MDKRTFLKSLGLGVASLPFLTQAATPVIGNKARPMKAKALKKGDTIGLIAPAGALEGEEAIELTREVFETLGFKVKEGTHLRARYGNLAGSDDQRLADLHSMFADPEVDGIVCVRGGNGASRLLKRIDFELIRRNPKVFLGYSDITALHLSMFAKTGLVGFHGAVGTSTWTKTVAGYFQDLIVDNKQVKYQNPTGAGSNVVQYRDRIRTITPGVVEGKLIGGNMTLITGLCGSEFLPSFENAILFIEEINENSDRMDRMFCQLMNAGILNAISGFIFGKCTNCGPSGGYGSLTIEQMLNDYIKPLGIPAYSGAVIGHINDQFIVPVGVEAKMDANEGTITLLEPSLAI